MLNYFHQKHPKNNHIIYFINEIEKIHHNKGLEKTPQVIIYVIKFISLGL